MRVKRFAATAMIAVGAVAVTAGAAQAQPNQAADISVTGAEHGVEYTTAPSVDGKSVVTTLASGAFTVTDDAKAVALTDSTGAVVATLPLAFQTNGQTFGLNAQIGEAGRTLTMTPVNAPTATEHIAQLVDEASDTQARKEHNAGVGALIGAGIGGVIGFFLGGVGALVTVPIGAGIGALIGYSTP
ncbi:hypothetical protein [Nocardia callitridis]|uniref:DUF8020 domain-containing protein n=1 Tax=Nocardia callitridis TaxID=648753 RepID=A0ABP9KSA3_9NOCA